MVNLKEYEVKGSLNCACGHCFDMSDFTELERINKIGFYANKVKHYSKTRCPNCGNDTILLLKQVGQTYKVIDIAIIKQVLDENKFICPECSKVCKSRVGLNAHLKIHEKNRY